jgi:CRP/FNR family transcriptional regulator, cyclic AMP receptor protein
MKCAACATGGLPVPTIDVFRNDPQSKTYIAGARIFEAGDAASEMFVVVDGEVEILLGKRVVETVGPGGIFGEMAIVDGEPRSASVVAKTDCSLVPVTRSRFTYLIQNTPFFAIEVMQILAARLRRMDRVLQELANTAE